MLKSVTIRTHLLRLEINQYIMGYADAKLEFKTDMITGENFEKYNELYKILHSNVAFKLTIEGLEPPKTKIKKKGAKKNKC